MSIVLNLRQGIGSDIEYNNDILHVIEVEGKETVAEYAGIIIKIPFISIYIGEFYV